MSPTLAFILALLATHIGLKVEVQIEEDAVKQMEEREEYLHQEMTRFLQETEASSGTRETLLPSAFQQHWLVWVSAAALVLVLLAGGCWLLRRRKSGSASSREEERSNRQEEVREQNEKQDLPSLEVLKELVDDVLGVCRVLSRGSLMPELHSATGTDTTPEAWSVQENRTAYRPLVILRPPPGHAFSADRAKPAGRVRVELECLCSREQLLGQMCFVHASGGQLPRDQHWYLLDTLCTGSYLDVEKVVRWVQTLVPSAWLLLPHSRHWQLTALSSSKSCIFQLTSTSGMQICLEMALAVQQHRDQLMMVTDVTPM